MAAFDWTHYLILARELGTRPEESALRSAISRAYYAAYNAAEVFCTNNAILILNSGNLHKDLWDAFLKKGGRTFTAVYDKGDRLRRKRTKADYDAEIQGLPSMTVDSLKECYEILTYLGLAPPAP